MKRLAAPSLLAAAAWLAAGCSFDPTVAAGKRIRCGGDADCPQEYVCRPGVGQCVLVADLIGTAPSIAASSVFPALGRAGTPFEASFTADRTLLRPPVVTAWNTGAQVGELELVEPGEEGAWRYRFTATGSEPEGITRVLADLADLGGNEARGVEVGTFRLDLTPPAVVAGSAGAIVFPPADSPVLSVSALGGQSRALVSFAVTEPLANGTPTLHSSGPLELTRASSQGPIYTFEVTVAAGTSIEQVAPVTATLEDEAGNRAEVDVLGEGLAIDSISPASPDTAAAGRIVYSRMPTGSASSQGKSEFRVRGGPGAAEAGGTLLIYAPDGLTLLGHADIDSDGGFGPTSLFAADFPEVRVRCADRAGNLSMAAKVRDVEWFAALNGGVPGSPDSPHALAVRRVHSPVLVQPSEDQRGTATGLDGGALVVDGAWTWQSRRFERFGNPTAVMVAYDPVRGRGYSFGGEFPNNAFGQELSFWDGQGWHYAASKPLYRPSPRSGGALAWDEHRQRLVLFGGKDGAGSLGDTWEFDGNQWAQLHPPSSPAPRSRFAFAYHPGRRTVVLFGGWEQASSTTFGDTWEWNGRVWTELPTPTAPAARRRAAMAFDRARRQLVLHGGTDASSTVLSDTWTFGADGAWTLASTAGPVRETFGFAYHVRRGSVMLFGGEGSSSGPLDDTWEWTGQWTQLSPSTARDARGDSQMFYDSARDQLVEIGAAGANFTTWAFRGDDWKVAAAPSTLSARRYAAAAYEVGTGSVVLYGGESGATNAITTLGDTWRFDGDTWRGVVDGGPTARTGAGMAYEAASGSVVLFGGATRTDAGVPTARGETWVLDGGRWTLAAGPAPPARFSQGMVSQPAGPVLLHGGTVTGSSATALDDTWAWTADAGWAQLDAGWVSFDGGAMLNRYGAAYLYDESRSSPVALGGWTLFGLSSEAWEFRDPSWWRLTDLTAGACFGAAAFDRGVGRAFLVGGYAAFSQSPPASYLTLVNGVWTSPGWADPEGDGNPVGRAGHVLVHLPTRRTTLLFGGSTGASLATSLADTWEAHTSTAAPSAVFRVALDAARIPLGVQFTRLRATARAGGTATSGAGAIVDGVALVPWFENAWRDPGGAPTQNAASAAAPQPVEVVVSSPDLLLRMLEGQGETAVALVPLGTNGSGLARVALENIEVEIDYRLPP